MAANVTCASENPFRFGTPKLFKSFPNGKPLQKDTKQIILNVYARLRESSSSITAAYAETSRLTGVSVSTISRVKSESKVYGEVRSPVRRSLDLSRKNVKLNHISKLDSFDTSAIRRKIHLFFNTNEIPTVDKLLLFVNEDDSLPSFKRTTFFKILKSLNFRFRKSKRNSALITRTELIQWRGRYLHAIREHRGVGRPIYYLDETWVNVGHSKTKVWHDDSVTSAREAKSAGLSVGLDRPSGKGSRLIITHAGNSDGFLTPALDIFEGKKGSSDYHQEMDGNRFEEWFRRKFLPHIKPNSVIVMDNASYHSVQVERLPTTKTRKADIQQWLTDKGIEWTPWMTVKDLLALVEPVRAQYVAYNVDTIATAAGHIVLRLPPYHCELNPIELIWSQVKGYVADQNKTFKIGEVRVLVQEAISRISPSNWEKCVKHVVEKIEPEFWSLDGLVNTALEPFIISFDEDSESSCDENDDLGVEPLCYYAVK